MAYDAASGGNALTTSETGLFYYYTDHLGSVGTISDANGAVQGDIIRYEPFGQLRDGAPSSATTDRGYTGHRENREVDAVLLQPSKTGAFPLQRKLKLMIYSPM